MEIRRIFFWGGVGGGEGRTDILSIPLFLKPELSQKNSTLVFQVFKSSFYCQGKRIFKTDN